MKIYYVSAAVISVFSLSLAVYFYFAMNRTQQDCEIYREENARSLEEKNSLQSQISRLEQEKARLEKEVANANIQLDRAGHSTAVLKTVLSSFMYAGDIKASTVGSKEAVQVEEAIVGLDDNMDRMSAEKDWSDFKKTLYFNPLFGLLRNLARSVETNLRQVPAQTGAENLQPVK